MSKPANEDSYITTTKLVEACSDKLGVLTATVGIGSGAGGGEAAGWAEAGGGGRRRRAAWRPPGGVAPKECVPLTRGWDHRCPAKHGPAGVVVARTFIGKRL